MGQQEGHLYKMLSDFWLATPAVCADIALQIVSSSCACICSVDKRVSCRLNFEQTLKMCTRKLYHLNIL